MKKILVLIAFTLSILLASDGYSQSKKHGPPSWAPAHGYRAKTKNIYFPDRNFYYNVEKGTYIYLNGGRWQVSVKLPSILSGFNLVTAHKVELDIDTDSPQRYNANHKIKYKGNSGKAKSKSHPGNHHGNGKGKKK